MRKILIQVFRGIGFALNVFPHRFIIGTMVVRWQISPPLTSACTSSKANFRIALKMHEIANRNIGTRSDRNP
jgi:hypothetical protein